MIPSIIAAASLLLGIGLIVGAVFIMAGTAWAMVAGAVPCLLFAAVIWRGMLHG